MSTNIVLEETMDKKLFSPKPCVIQGDVPRLRQGDGASLGVNQSSSNQFPKSSKSQSRRRDSPGVSNASFRPGPSSRKTFPPKGKGKGNRVVESVEQIAESDRGSESAAEFGSLQLPGGKKQNLTHLLNFHFAPREAQGRGFVPFHGTRTNRPKQFNDSFIQANCQFMVAADEDLEYQVDLLVNWKFVEQIIIRTYDETPGCPICLAHPSAAKITKCGHIFCWSCILRYFSYSDGHSQSCPICFNSITPQELKSVVANVLKEFHVEDYVNMQLMCRKKDSTSGEMPIASKLGANVEDWEKRFKKLLPVDSRVVQTQIIEREYFELTQQLDGAIESLETEFVVAAMNALNKRKKLLMEKIDETKGKAKEICDTVNSDYDVSEGERHSESSSVGELNHEFERLIGADEDVKVASVQNSFAKDTVESENINWEAYSCFYQAADGSNAFMNPLNMAMLWKNFGKNPSNWPQNLVLRVIEIELMTITPDLRKRMKFLKHLPVNSLIQLIEFELITIVSKEILAEFNYQLNERKRRRCDRSRQEKRRERLQEEAERRAIPRKPKIECRYDFPEYGTPEEETKMLERAYQESLLIHTERNTLTQASPTAGAPDNVDQSFPELPTSPYLSFAQALNTPCVWKRSPTFPVTTKHEASSGGLRQRGTSENELDQTTSNTVPKLGTNMSDVIASAFASFALNNEGAESGSSSIGQKKKGRKKGKVLFATGMGMGNN